MRHHETSVRASALQHIVVPACPHTVIIALNLFQPVLSVNHQTIIVLDFGSQYTQLIARRLRELSVYSEIWPPDTPAAKIRARQPVGIILSGGPKSVSDPGAPRCDPALFELGDAGARHLLRHAVDGAHRSAGRVAPAPQREFGHAIVSVDRPAAPAGGACSSTCRRRSASGRATATSSRPRPRDSRSWRRARTRRSPRWRIRTAGSTRFCSIPRSSTPNAASRFFATSRTASAAAPATGRWRRSSKRRRRRIRAQVGRGPRRRARSAAASIRPSPR